MKTILTIIFSVAIFAAISCLGTNAQSGKNVDNLSKDSIPPPVIDIIPSDIKIPWPKDKFITEEVKILNRGGLPLIIEKVSGSCFCSSAKVMNNEVYPLEIGKLLLMINTDGLSDTNNIVEFYIESNAENSPFVIRVEVVNKKNEKH